MEDKPLYIPIILGTARQGRQSEHVANFLLSEMKKRPEIETELIDVRQLKMRLDDAGETMKDPEFAKKMTRADGLAIVTPEGRWRRVTAVETLFTFCPPGPPERANVSSSSDSRSTEL